MEYGAIDLHTRRSQIRIVDQAGAVVLDRRIDTSRAEFVRLFGRRSRMRLLVESGTESEWVAQCLEACGHDVIVADPNFTPMYSQRSRRVKTDRRDAATLAEACRRGLYRVAHRVSARQRTIRQTLRARTHCVRVRTGTISVLRAVLRQEGVRLPGGKAETVGGRVDRVALPRSSATVVAPLRELLAALEEIIGAVDRQLATIVAEDQVVRQLMTAPGVGPIVALTYRAVLDDPARFGGDARRASAFLGLVPSEASSGERRHRGGITKTGPRDLRALLVQAAWAVVRGRSPAGAALRSWARTVAARRGVRVAVVGAARRLSRILFAMWRERTDFRWPSAVQIAGA